MYNCRKRKICSCSYNCNSNNNFSMNCDCNKDMLVLSDKIIIDNESCDCGFEEEKMFPKNPMLAQSYVPIQQLRETFCPYDGLNHGTLFPELIRPYRPGQSVEEIAFIKAMNYPKEGCNKC